MQEFSVAIQLLFSFRVVLPISRGAIIGGVSLVTLEVLNDYGVVKYYGVPTFFYSHFLKLGFPWVMWSRQFDYQLYS